MSKAKRWCFTSFNVDNEPTFSERLHEYLIYGRETCPDTSRVHLQGFVVFKNRQTLAGCKKFIPGAHFERARGTPAEASDYCKKDENFKEFGTLPSTTGRTTGLGDVLAAAQRGDFAYIKTQHPGTWFRYKAAILTSIEYDTTELNNSCGVWMCGPPRSSKDYGVLQLADMSKVYLKCLNKWWDGYQNQPYVLISDVQPSHSQWLGYFLKIWCDRYPFNAEIKGGTILIRPKKVFVTSNFMLDAVFTNEIYDALKARMNIYCYCTGSPVVHKRMCVRPSDQFLKLLLEHEDGLLPCPQKEVLSSTESGQAVSPQEAFLSPHEIAESRPSTSAE